MSKVSTTSEPPADQSGGEKARAQVAPPGTAASASRTTRARKPVQPRAAKPRAPQKKKEPGAAERTALESVRTELAAARKELADVRREVSEAVAACRDAESRADAVRRTVAEVDASATDVRAIAEAAREEVRRIHELSGQTEERLVRLREWLKEARGEFAALEADSLRTIDSFRAAVEETKRAATGELALASAAELPDTAPLPPGERAADIRERFIHLLNDAWGMEKEQAVLLETLAEESGDRGVRALLEEHRAIALARQGRVEAHLEVLGARAAAGRGLLGQLATRLWDAVQAPRDQADRAVLAVLKALSAAESLAGLYAAVHTAARSAGDSATADFAAAHYRDVRNRADELRAALPPTVDRAVRR